MVIQILDCPDEDLCTFSVTGRLAEVKRQVDSLLACPSPEIPRSRLTSTSGTKASSKEIIFPMLNRDEHEQIINANNQALEQLARRWRNPGTGKNDPDPERAIRQMVCDYFGFPSRAGQDLYRVISDQARTTYWANRVCLHPLDIYDEDDEMALAETLGDEKLKLVRQSKDEGIEADLKRLQLLSAGPFWMLERSIEETRRMPALCRRSTQK